MAKNYNCAVHTGRVVAAQLTDRTARISLEMNIRRDSFASGSRAKQQRNGEKRS